MPECLKANTRRQVMLAGVVLLINVLVTGCGGGCSRTENAAVQETSPAEERQNAEKILGRPVSFDAQSLDEVLQLVESSRTLSSAEKAECIVTAESGVTRLLHIIDDLRHNDDAADTWNVLNELNRVGWPRTTARILEVLEQKHQLDTRQYERVEQLQGLLDQAREMALELHAANRAMPVPTF